MRASAAPAQGKAVGLPACEHGIRLRYARCVDLLDDLHAGLADGSCRRRFKSWATAELLRHRLPKHDATGDPKPRSAHYQDEARELVHRLRSRHRERNQ